MALTEVEKKRVQRARKEAELRSNVDGAYQHLNKGFAAYVADNSNYQNVEIALSIAGIEAPLFENECGPLEYAINDVMVGVENPFSGAEGAIGRAEVMIDCLIDAATEMASIVNAYKKRELETRLEELASDETIDRAQAISDAQIIRKKLDQLEKQVRRSFPQWRVTGQ